MMMIKANKDVSYYFSTRVDIRIFQSIELFSEAFPTQRLLRNMRTAQERPAHVDRGNQKLECPHLWSHKNLKNPTII